MYALVGLIQQFLLYDLIYIAMSAKLNMSIYEFHVVHTQGSISYLYAHSSLPRLVCLPL